MNKTEELELNLPEPEDFFDIQHQNENAEIIDKKIAEITSLLSDKAETNGSNASGNWNINITGNAKTATKATSADSATKDASGNVISSTYSKTNHTHNYAGSSSAGGVANSATKLNTNAGSATQPTYFADGIPKACTYTLEKSVPADAVFTDTKYTNKIGMTDLGFTKNSTYTVHEFFTTICEKGYSGKISLRFRYDNSTTAKISDGTTTIDMNGADCYLSVYGTISEVWKKNYAIVSIDNNLYLLYEKCSGSSTPSSQRITNLRVATSCTGNSATATKATQDGNGNVITDTYAEKETIALKSATGTNISIADSKEAPMILNYAPVNLFSHSFATTTKSGITFTANADGTITANGTATANITVNVGTYTFTENDIGKVFSWSDNGATLINWDEPIIYMYYINDDDTWRLHYKFTVKKAHTVRITIYIKEGQVVENRVFRPMLEEGSTYHTYVPYTGYDITASNDEASKSTSVTINSETVFPVNGLESYDGLTNVLNPYSATMEVTYATNEAGQGVLKEIETIEDTLAYKIAKLSNVETYDIADFFEKSADITGFELTGTLQILGEKIVKIDIHFINYSSSRAEGQFTIGTLKKGLPLNEVERISAWTYGSKNAGIFLYNTGKMTLCLGEVMTMQEVISFTGTYII